MTNRVTLQRVVTLTLLICCCVVLAGCKTCTCGVAGKAHPEEQVKKQDAAATPYWSPPPKTAAEQSAAQLAALEKSTGFSLELMNVPCTLEKERHSASVGAPMEKYTVKTRKTFYVPGDPFGPGGNKIPIKCVHNKNQPSFSFSGNGVNDYLFGTVVISSKGKAILSFEYATKDPANNLKMIMDLIPFDYGQALMDPKLALYYLSTTPSQFSGLVTQLEWSSSSYEVNGHAASLKAKDLSSAQGLSIKVYK